MGLSFRDRRDRAEGEEGEVTLKSDSDGTEDVAVGGESHWVSSME